VYDVYDNQCARDYAVVLDELASVLTRKGDDGSLGLALELHQEILSLKEKGLQDENSEYRKALASAAKMLDMRGDLIGAIQLYQELHRL